MNKPYRGGTQVHIQGVDIYIPKKPKRELIANHDLPKRKQKFIRTLLPDDWDELRADEEERKEASSKYRNPTLERFRKQEWKRRTYGYWFYNNGTPTYITGPNYFYINWCKLDHAENDGYPIYYDYTRRTFYFRQYCVEMETVLGYLVIGPRGTGKSSEEVACILESITRMPGRRKAAIQSKSMDDAKDKIFKEKMVEIYKCLPDFFKPISNHGTNPEGKLSFFYDTVRGKKAHLKQKLDEEELANVVYPVPAKEKALDGGTFSDILNDEIGKTDPKKEANVHKRMAVNRFCVYRNNRKVGVIRATTTVEEMDKGGAECFKVWKDSDQGNLTANNFTISGLYRFFISAIDAGTKFVDEYGFVDEDRMRRFHDIERDARKGDPVEYSSYLRKNPYNWQEAFMVNADQCVFNAMILNDVHSILNLDDDFTDRGDFVWRDGITDGKVVFEHNSHNGRFFVSWLPDKDEDTNKVKQTRSTWMHNKEVKQWKPDNDEKFAIATDPVDHKKTVDASRKSMAAAYCFRKYDYHVDAQNVEKVTREGETEWETYNFVCEYLYRPLEPQSYYEDMIKMCVFYGCQILVENQKQGILHYFKQRGYQHFIMHRPENTFTTKGKSQDTEGIPASRQMIQQYTDKLQTFVQFHGHRIKFRRLVVDLLGFDPNEPTKFDAAVAGGFTLIANEKPMPKKREVIEGQGIVPTYNNKGNRSVLIKR